MTGEAATRNRPGFTLIELLMVMLIIGILAAAMAWRVREPTKHAHLAAMKSDLRSLSFAQEMHYQTASEYGTLEELSGFQASKGVTVELAYLDPRAYAAIGTHASLGDVTCAVYRGEAAAAAAGPAAVENAIVCE